MDPETPSEVAKAAKELAVLGQMGMAFAERVFGYPLEQWFGQYGDKWKFERQVQAMRFSNLLKAAAAYAEGDMGSVHQVSPKLLNPIIEGAVLEDDEDLAARWAALLATAAIAAQRVEPSFPRMLSEMTAADARLFDLIFREAYARGRAIHGTAGKWPAKPEDALDGVVDIDRLGLEASGPISIDNLARLRVITREAGLHVQGAGQAESSLTLRVNDSKQIRLTPFGVAFWVACNPGTRPLDAIPQGRPFGEREDSYTQQYE